MNTEVLKLAIQGAIKHRQGDAVTPAALGILDQDIVIRPVDFEHPDWKFVCIITPSNMNHGMISKQWDIVATKLLKVIERLDQ